MADLTSEQRRVVESTARLLAVDAFAGTGKTSTLVDYACARPDARILYIAFNKSVATEARSRFPGNVECRTTHSLAYGAVGRKYAAKLGNAQAWEVAQTFNCPPRRARQVLQTLASWLCTTQADISLDDVGGDALPEDAKAIVQTARSVWVQMIDPRTPLKMSHDGYLKLWAMTKPRLPYDIILLDEAQDTNPITLELVMAQQGHATLVLVGDRHQGIYGFRKATNAMEQVEADERVAITRSFRFGQAIADVATALLSHFKNEPLPVRGRSDIEVAWSIDRAQHYAVLGRTNAGLFTAAAELVADAENRRLHFIGGFDSYLFGKVLDAYHLWMGDRARIKDASIGRFSDFDAFRAYGIEAEDAETKALVRTVELYRSDVPRLYNAIRAADTPVQESAQVTLTTGHRAKGLEWEQVELLDDYFDPMNPPTELDLEEVNLLYVGVTRAIRAVQLPPGLTAWLRAGDRVALPASPPTRSTPLLPVDECAEHENWLRENVDEFGAAATDIRFLLQQLDAARAARPPSKVN